MAGAVPNIFEQAVRVGASVYVTSPNLNKEKWLRKKQQFVSVTNIICFAIRLCMYNTNCFCLAMFRNGVAYEMCMTMLFNKGTN